MTSHPEQAEFRSLLGKFYHRPPGCESWCDVIPRPRSLLDTVSLHYGGRRVMIVAHQVSGPLPSRRGGARLSETMASIGFLARELAPLVPGLMRGV